MRLYWKKSFWQTLAVPRMLFFYLLLELIKMSVVAVLCIAIAKAIFLLLGEPDPLTSETLMKQIETEKSKEREKECDLEKQLHQLLEKKNDSIPTPADVAETVAEALPDKNLVS